MARPTSRVRVAAKPLRYHLRFQILPGPNVERHARILAAFCRRHGIEEVVLFYAAEEWNNGLLSREDEDRWFDALRRAKPILERAGLTVSLNPWATVLHGDNGRRFPPDRPFRPMVSPKGETSRACASFADPAWRSYLAEQYGCFARLGFRVLWIEDDFRYHNHKPLTWGGGFEPEMLERFARRVGRPVEREEVLANLLRPGEPHPWRALWMETWREAQREAARAVAKAVAENAPCPARLGLMSSDPCVHGTEGRDWGALFDALAIGGGVAHRPWFLGSGDFLGRDLAPCILRLDVQRTLRPARCEVAPEIENYPYTRWARSDALTWSVMAMCLFFGSDALLLDLFPFAANPADREPEIGAMLDRSRPALEWICRRLPTGLPSAGVAVPWREDAQARVRLRTDARGDLTALDASFHGPARFLLGYGVPITPSDAPVAAVFGNLAWAFGDEEWRAMLRGGVLLDGIAAEILQERGFGPSIGAAVEGWLERQESNYAVQEVVASALGVPKGHFFNANKAVRLAVLKPLDGAKAWTQVVAADGRALGAGVVSYTNSAGGRVAVWAAPDPAANLFPDFHWQRLVHRAVDFLAGGRFPMPRVSGGPHLFPMHFREGERNVLVVLNGSADPARPFVGLPPHTQPARVRGTLLAPLERPRPMLLQSSGTRARPRVVAQREVPHLGYLVLEW